MKHVRSVAQGNVRQAGNTAVLGARDSGARHQDRARGIATLMAAMVLVTIHPSHAQSTAQTIEEPRSEAPSAVTTPAPLSPPVARTYAPVALDEPRAAPRVAAASAYARWHAGLFPLTIESSEGPVQIGIRPPDMPRSSLTQRHADERMVAVCVTPCTLYVPPGEFTFRTLPAPGDYRMHRVMVDATPTRVTLGRTGVGRPLAGTVLLLGSIFTTGIAAIGAIIGFALPFFSSGGSSQLTTFQSLSLGGAMSGFLAGAIYGGAEAVRLIAAPGRTTIEHVVTIRGPQSRNTMRVWAGAQPLLGGVVASVGFTF